MNTIDRILDGYTWLWRKAFYAVLCLLLIAVAAIVGGGFAAAPTFIGTGLVILILITALAWHVGDPDRLP